MSTTIASLTIGQLLPVVVRQASRAQLFVYSAATWNPHRIHYDRDYAAFEGHSDVLVHGPLQGAWLSQYIVDWIGPAGRLTKLSWQNRASAFPDEDLHFGGKVTAIDGDLVSLDVWEARPDGQTIMPAIATVQLPVA